MDKDVAAGKKRKQKEMWRQKDILFKRLKKMHTMCGVSTMTILISPEGKLHIHSSPDLQDFKYDCVKPVSDFALTKKYAASELKKKRKLNTDS